MTLKEKLAAMKADFESKAPREALAVMHRVTDELRTSGLAERALQVGDKAPPFALPTGQGETVRLEDLLAKGPLVLTFYRGAW